MGKAIKNIGILIGVVFSLCGIILFIVNYSNLSSNVDVLKGKVETLEKENYQLKGERDRWKEHYIELIEKIASKQDIDWKEVKSLLSEKDWTALNYKFDIMDSNKATASSKE